RKHTSRLPRRSSPTRPGRRPVPGIRPLARNRRRRPGLLQLVRRAAGRGHQWRCEGRARALNLLWLLLTVFAGFAAVRLVWRWASRIWSLPCPSVVAWMVDNPLMGRMTRVTLDRLDLRPGQRVLEIGPGPGRLLIPAARRVLPHGEAVGIDIQPGMVERLRAAADRAGATNLTAILGDAARPHGPEASFDLVFLCTALGEIPDRAAALRECHRALKPGGVLAVTEVLGDPHYQSRSAVRRLAEAVGFRPQRVQGGLWFYTASFVKDGGKGSP